MISSSVEREERRDHDHNRVCMIRSFVRVCMYSRSTGELSQRSTKVIEKKYSVHPLLSVQQTSISASLSGSSFPHT